MHICAAASVVALALVAGIKLISIQKCSDKLGIAVYKMRLPDSTSATKKAPYIIHQIVTSKDTQPSGQLEAGSAVVRSIFCVYCNDEQEGAMHLLNLIERLRIRLLQDVVIGGQFELDLEVGVETLIYLENTAPYFAGEMSTTWKMPSVERKWREWL